MLTTDELVAPDFASIGSGFETAANRLLSHCRLHALFLDALAGHLESSEPEQPGP